MVDNVVLSSGKQPSLTANIVLMCTGEIECMYHGDIAACSNAKVERQMEPVDRFRICDLPLNCCCCCCCCCYMYIRIIVLGQR